MVNNNFKGNMLSTAVLTDMHRYHKLKSNTGVENRLYDQVWLQERIEEEKNDIGLSLDCAQPSPSQLQAALTNGTGNGSIHQEGGIAAGQLNSTLGAAADTSTNAG